MADSKDRCQKTETPDDSIQSVFWRARFLVCVILTTVITMALSVNANAQSASFRSVDTNRDGVLSYNELVAQFGRAGADRLLRQLDRNRDTILTIQELRQRDDEDDRSTRSDDDRDDGDDGDDGDDRDDGDDDNDRDDDDGGDDGGDDDDDDDGDRGDD